MSQLAATRTGALGEVIEGNWRELVSGLAPCAAPSSCSFSPHRAWISPSTEPAICDIVMVMSRPLRIQFPGALYHITSRGDGRDPIYFDDSDRTTFLAVLSRVCERYNWSCHSYCLMTNHYHLLMETRAPTLARGMRHLNGVYTQRFNRAHARVGHVYPGALLGSSRAEGEASSRGAAIHRVEPGACADCVRC